MGLVVHVDICAFPTQLDSLAVLRLFHRTTGIFQVRLFLFLAYHSPIKVGVELYIPAGSSLRADP